MTPQMVDAGRNVSRTERGDLRFLRHFVPLCKARVVPDGFVGVADAWGTALAGRTLNETYGTQEAGGTRMVKLTADGNQNQLDPSRKPARAHGTSVHKIPMVPQRPPA